MAATPQHLSSSWRQFAVVAVISVAWTAVSSWIIVLNKHLLADLQFHYPMALSSLGMLFSSVASFLACKVFKLVPMQTTTIDTWFYLRNILPIGLLNALTMLFGNSTYLYLSMSLIQMLKAFQPTILMITLWCCGLESVNWQLTASLLIITCGTALASVGQVSLSLVGLALMFSAELTECARMVLTQKLLKGHDFHAVEGVMYLAPACLFWLLCGSCTFELSTMLRHGAFVTMADNPVLFGTAAILGFITTVTAYMVVILASSLVLKVLATVRNAIIVSIGVMVVHEVVRPLQSLGYATSLVGFAWFNYLKMASSSSQQLSPPSSRHSVINNVDDTYKPLL